MASTSVKSTYALDVETVRLLEDLARREGISKSEALRRAIRLASGAGGGSHAEALQRLDRLQERLALDAKSARRWAEQIRSERRESDRSRRQRRR